MEWPFAQNNDKVGPAKNTSLGTTRELKSQLCDIEPLPLAAAKTSCMVTIKHSTTRPFYSRLKEFPLDHQQKLTSEDLVTSDA